MHIFSFLKIQDLSRASRVSKLYRIIAYNSKFGNITYEKISYVIRKCANRHTKIECLSMIRALKNLVVIIHSDGIQIENNIIKWNGVVEKRIMIFTPFVETLSEMGPLRHRCNRVKHGCIVGRFYSVYPEYIVSKTGHQCKLEEKLEYVFEFDRKLFTVTMDPYKKTTVILYNMSLEMTYLAKAKNGVRIIQTNDYVMVGDNLFLHNDNKIKLDVIGKLLYFGNKIFTFDDPFVYSINDDVYESK